MTISTIFFNCHKNYDGFKGGLGISENTLKKLENKVPLINEYCEKIGFAKYESYNDSNDCKTKVRKAVKKNGSCLKDGNISQEQQENFEQKPLVRTTMRSKVLSHGSIIPSLKLWQTVSSRFLLLPL